jgi:hypothetical protein
VYLLDDLVEDFDWKIIDSRHLVVAQGSAQFLTQDSCGDLGETRCGVRVGVRVGVQVLPVQCRREVVPSDEVTDHHSVLSHRVTLVRDEENILTDSTYLNSERSLNPEINKKCR